MTKSSRRNTADLVLNPYLDERRNRREYTKIKTRQSADERRCTQWDGKSKTSINGGTLAQSTGTHRKNKAIPRWMETWPPYPYSQNGRPGGTQKLQTSMYVVLPNEDRRSSASGKNILDIHRICQTIWLSKRPVPLNHSTRRGYGVEIGQESNFQKYTSPWLQKSARQLNHGCDPSMPASHKCHHQRWCDRGWSRHQTWPDTRISAIPSIIPDLHKWPTALLQEENRKIIGR